jgi:hypothetical protein
MPGMLLFSPSEFGLRFGAILVSFYMTYQVVQLGKEVGGSVVGLLSGILIAVSPVYNWTSNAFGWSVTVTMLLLCVRLLRNNPLDLRTPEGRKACALVNTLVTVAFLINTGNILFSLSTGLLYFLFNYRNIPALIKAFAPFVLFYLLYYFIYMVVVPYVAATYYNETASFGQAGHGVGRLAQSYLNVTSFVENLQGINAYFFPYVSWLFLLCGAYYLVRHEWIIAFWLSIFAGVWSFYLTTLTAQYFLLVFIVIVPFALKFIYDRLGLRPFLVSMGVLVLFIALWNWQIFIRVYGSDDPDYPHRLLALGSADVSRLHNIEEPFAQVAADIEARLGAGESFVHDLAGSFTLYYYRSERYAGTFGSVSYPYRYHPTEDCAIPQAGFEQVRIVVTAKELCQEVVQERIAYPNSIIKLFVLRRE